MTVGCQSAGESRNKEPKRHPLQVYLTGHSLGGALATLAAYDVARALEACPQRTHVLCYSFGSPRVGNHAFAHAYMHLVPDTWSIINDQVRIAAGYSTSHVVFTVYTDPW